MKSLNNKHIRADKILAPRSQNDLKKKKRKRKEGKNKIKTTITKSEQIKQTRKAQKSLNHDGFTCFPAKTTNADGHITPTCVPMESGPSNYQSILFSILCQTEEINNSGLYFEWFKRHVNRPRRKQLRRHRLFGKKIYKEKKQVRETLGVCQHVAPPSETAFFLRSVRERSLNERGWEK